jgi:hypothetical protein
MNGCAGARSGRWLRREEHTVSCRSTRPQRRPRTTVEAGAAWPWDQRPTTTRPSPTVRQIVCIAGPGPSCAARPPGRRVLPDPQAVVCCQTSRPPCAARPPGRRVLPDLRAVVCCQTSRPSCAARPPGRRVLPDLQAVCPPTPRVWLHARRIAGPRGLAREYHGRARTFGASGAALRRYADIHQRSAVASTRVASQGHGGSRCGEGRVPLARAGLAQGWTMARRRHAVWTTPPCCLDDAAMLCGRRRHAVWTTPPCCLDDAAMLFGRRRHAVWTTPPCCF